MDLQKSLILVQVVYFASVQELELRLVLSCLLDPDLNPRSALLQRQRLSGREKREEGEDSWEYNYLRELIVSNNGLVAQNRLQAIELVQRTIEKGDGRGMFFLAQLYEFGLEEIQAREALKWYYLADLYVKDTGQEFSFGQWDAGYNRSKAALSRVDRALVIEEADRWYSDWFVSTKEERQEDVKKSELEEDQAKIVANAVVEADEVREVQLMIELRYWESVCSPEHCNDIDLLKSYASRYPEGQFLDIARIKISRLEKQSLFVTSPAGVLPSRYADINFGRYYALVSVTTSIATPNF